MVVVVLVVLTCRGIMVVVVVFTIGICSSVIVAIMVVAVVHKRGVGNAIG